jgi:hypothetical protein
MQRKEHTPAARVMLDARALVAALRGNRGHLFGGMHLRECEAAIWTRKAINEDDLEETAAHARRLCRAIRGNRGRTLRGLSADEQEALAKLEASLQQLDGRDAP